MLIKHLPEELGIPLTHPTMRNYLINWICVLIVGIALYVRNRKKLQQQWAGYFDFLFLKWKLVTFVLSGLFVSLAGYWTDDESWDIISGFGMSLFTFLVGPLAIGIILRTLRGKETILNIYLAIVFSFFSFSWFYDGYLILRDGVYNPRWYGNMILSGIIYVCAGFFWNLELTPTGKITLGFIRPDWPKPPSNHGIAKAFILIGIPLGFIALVFIVGFVGWTHPVLNALFSFLPRPYR
tara:strand:- start:141606 stop:142319 length:714 start_codon:yes stop_codon:yes gene_type:complete